MEPDPKVRTCLFLRENVEEAVELYVAAVPGSRIESAQRPGPGLPVAVMSFSLAGAPYMAMSGNPNFVSSYDVSISVLTEDQEETDRVWSALLTGGGLENRCGWLIDRFGVHWQVTPRILPSLLAQGGAAAQRAHDAMLTMTKIDIAKLERAAAE